jgi:hypothetical protein
MGPATAATAEQPEWPGAALEPLPRTLGSAPLTLQSSQFIAGLAVSHGITPTLRPLEHGAAGGGPAGVIGGLAGPAIRRPGAPAGPPGGGTGHAPLAAAVRGSGGSAASSPVAASESGAVPERPAGLGADASFGLRRWLPVVDLSAAERGHSYASVDPASDPGWLSGRMQLAGAGPGARSGRDAAANPAVYGRAGSPTETPDSVPGASASGMLAEGGPAPVSGGLAPKEGQSHLSAGRVRRIGLGAPLAGIPGSAQLHGLGSSQPPRAAGPEGTRESGTVAGAAAAAETLGRRPSIIGGAARALPVLSVASFSPAGSPAERDRAASSGRENQTLSFAAAGP